MLRFYIMPIIGTGSSMTDPRKPKYSSRTDVSSRFWSMIDYGMEPVCVFAAEVTEAEHTALAAHADVLTFPENLDVELGSNQVSRTLKDALESFGIPANWVGNSDTYRVVLHTVAGMFMFMQRLNAMLPTPLFGSGITLDSAYGTIPAEMQQALVAAANSFGWDTTVIKPTSSLRQLLKFMADAWGTVPIEIMGQVL